MNIIARELNEYLNSWNSLEYWMNDPKISNIETNRKIGIVISSGPSANDAIPALKIIDKSKCIIIACDSAFKMLINYGIKPDIVVFGDPIINTCEYIKDVQLPYETIYAYEPRVHVLTLQQFENNQRIYYNCNNPLLTMLKLHMVDFQELNARGSITVVAIEMLLKLECEQIYLIGADSCFHNDQTHCEGKDTEYYDEAVLPKKNIKKVKNIKNQSVETTDALMLYRELIEEKIKNNPKVEFFKVNEHKGLRLKKSKVIGIDSFAEAVNKNPEGYFQISKFYSKTIDKMSLLILGNAINALGAKSILESKCDEGLYILFAPIVNAINAKHIQPEFLDIFRGSMLHQIKHIIEGK